MIGRGIENCIVRSKAKVTFAVLPRKGEEQAWQTTNGSQKNERMQLFYTVPVPRAKQYLEIRLKVCILTLFRRLIQRT